MQITSIMTLDRLEKKSALRAYWNTTYDILYVQPVSNILISLVFTHLLTLDVLQILLFKV